MTYNEFSKRIDSKIFSQDKKILFVSNSDPHLFLYCIDNNYYNWVRITPNQPPIVSKGSGAASSTMTMLHNHYNNPNHPTYIISEELSRSLINSPEIALAIIEQTCEKLKL